MVLIKHFTIVLFAKTTEKHALISPGFDCFSIRIHFLIRATSAYRRHICIWMALRRICKYILFCVRQYFGHLKNLQRTRALSRKRKHKCGERTCTHPSVSMSVLTWPTLDMAKSGVVMFEEWVSVSFDFSYNLIIIIIISIFTQGNLFKT